MAIGALQTGYNTLYGKVADWVHKTDKRAEAVFGSI